jgi:hypothetical protein
MAYSIFKKCQACKKGNIPTRSIKCIFQCIPPLFKDREANICKILQGLNTNTEADRMAALAHADNNFLLQTCTLISYYATSSGNSNV